MKNENKKTTSNNTDKAEYTDLSKIHFTDDKTIPIIYYCPLKVHSILKSLVEQGFFRTEQEAVHNFVYEGLKRDGVIQFGRGRPADVQKDLYGQDVL